MSMSTMTPDGELMIPNGWAGQIDDTLSLDSNRPLTNKAITEALQTIDHDIEQLLQLRSSLSQYGLSKICPTDLTTATEDNGLVLGAKEKNPAIEGSIMNRVEGNVNYIKQNFYSFDNNGKFIKSNEDLNTYMQLGKYFCNNYEITNSLLNCPFKNDVFTLIVQYYSSGIYFVVKQTITAEISGFIYNRIHSGIDFGKWRVIRPEEIQ